MEWRLPIPKKDKWTLEELAQRWNCDDFDIVRLAIAKHIPQIKFSGDAISGLTYAAIMDDDDLIEMLKKGMVIIGPSDCDEEIFPEVVVKITDCWVSHSSIEIAEERWPTLFADKPEHQPLEQSSIRSMEHDFYTLDDAAKRIGCEVKDLLKRGAESKINLWGWYNGAIVENRKATFGSNVKKYMMIRNDDIMNIYLDGRTRVNAFKGPDSDLFMPHRHSASVSSNALSISHETLTALMNEFYKKPVELVSDAADIENAEKSNAEFLNSAVTISSIDVVGKLPREAEKPIRTMQAIAVYCKAHKDTVRGWRKKYKDFPASRPGEGTGTVTALPSELNAWLVKRNKT
jgi:hypothetical protein